MVLLDAIEKLVPEVWDSMLAVDTALDRLAGVSASVEDHLKMFRFLELQGRIEAARANDTEHVRVLFDEIGRQVRAAGAELAEITALGDRRNREDPAAAGGCSVGCRVAGRFRLTPRLRAPLRSLDSEDRLAPCVLRGRPLRTRPR